jgi:uncharacterized protein (DUF2062 family)
MLFGRKSPPRWGEKLRVWLWPRRNWSRSSRYVAYRMWRLRATPHAIALGCASGVFASCTPYLGAHFILAGVLAWITRSSILASALGTFFGNPLTFPFIWIASYQLGNWALGRDSNVQTIDLSGGIFDKSMEQLLPLLKPMTVGGIPLGFTMGTIFYFIVKQASVNYQNKKRQQRSLKRGRPAQA